jgi:hypothetical protein
MRIKVTCEVPTTDNPAKPSIRVHSHWNDRGLVVIEIGDKSVTVEGDNLIAAIDNAMRTGR